MPSASAKRLVVLGRGAQQAAEALAVDHPVQRQRAQHHDERGSSSRGSRPSRSDMPTGTKPSAPNSPPLAAPSGLRLDDIDAAQLGDADCQQRIVEAFEPDRRERDEDAEDQAEHRPGELHRPPGKAEIDRQVWAAVRPDADGRETGEREDAGRADGQHPDHVDRRRTSRSWWRPMRRTSCCRTAAARSRARSARAARGSAAGRRCAARRRAWPGYRSSRAAAACGG